jgi:hypothetical protein
MPDGVSGFVLGCKANLLIELTFFQVIFSTALHGGLELSLCKSSIVLSIFLIFDAQKLLLVGVCSPSS